MTLTEFAGLLVVYLASLGVILTLTGVSFAACVLTLTSSSRCFSC